MSRVLPFLRPTLDYELWRQVRGHAAIVDKEMATYLAEIDRGDSAISDYWTEEGRSRSANDDSIVYDFIALSSIFDGWFDKLRLDRASLLEEIEKIGRAHV